MSKKAKVKKGKASPKKKAGGKTAKKKSSPAKVEKVDQELSVYLSDQFSVGQMPTVNAAISEYKKLHDGGKNEVTKEQVTEMIEANFPPMEREIARQGVVTYEKYLSDSVE